MTIKYFKTVFSGVKNRIFRVKRYGFSLSILFVIMIVLASCSTTKHIAENDQLFIGLKEIEYVGNNTGEHYETTREEVEASLATAPNGALFGSSYYRTPFPYALWIWNAFSQSKGGAAKWITKTFFE